MQNKLRPVSGRQPLDFPVPDRPHRVYAALTNHCNRACPWCSTCSSPGGRSFMSLETFEKNLPAGGPFEVQLEGGEPTTHPGFDDFVRASREHRRCRRLVVSTNGVLIPRDPENLIKWLDGLGPQSTVKLSVNHHLLQRDDGLLDLAVALDDLTARLGGGRALVVNVRLRKGSSNDDRAVTEAVTRAGLTGCANIFFLQRCGYGDDRSDWEAPFLVGSNFRMIIPDGTDCGIDMVARAEAMRKLP